MLINHFQFTDESGKHHACFSFIYFLIINQPTFQEQYMCTVNKCTVLALARRILLKFKIILGVQFFAL